MGSGNATLPLMSHNNETRIASIAQDVQIYEDHGAENEHKGSHELDPARRSLSLLPEVVTGPYCETAMISRNAGVNSRDA